MNNKKGIFTRVVIKWLITSILLLLLLAIAAAVFYDFDGYREVTVVKMGTEFSFEYPVSYKDHGTLSENSPEINSVILDIGAKNSVEHPLVKQIYIHADEKSLLFPSTEVQLEKYLDGHNNAPWDNEFSLIEKMPFNISDVWGTMIFYSEMANPNGAFGYNLVITRVLYFEYNDLLWEIGITSISELAEESHKEFEHMLNSFSFN